MTNSISDDIFTKEVATICNNKHNILRGALCGKVLYVLIMRWALTVGTIKEKKLFSVKGAHADDADYSLKNMLYIFWSTHFANPV